ncbi:MAG TPA: LysM peptidoglycan-binding domain-containing protein, partial [Anaerolineales bacterium]
MADVVFGVSNPIYLGIIAAAGSSYGDKVGEAIFLQANAPNPPPPGTELQPTATVDGYNYFLVDGHWFVEHKLDNYPDARSYSYGAITVPDKLSELSDLYCKETLTPEEYTAYRNELAERLANNGQTLAEIEENIHPVGQFNAAPADNETPTDTRDAAGRIQAGETHTGEPLNEWISVPNSDSRYIWVRSADGTLTQVVDAGNGKVLEAQYSATGEQQLILLHDGDTGETYTTLDNRPVETAASESGDYTITPGDVVATPHWDSAARNFDADTLAFIEEAQSAMRFDSAIEFVLGAEGGYSNNPNDLGGETNYGISQWAFRTAQSQGILDPDISSVDGITQQDAVNVYRELFWNDSSLHIDDVGSISPNLSTALFDFAVNSGADDAIRVLQEVLGVPADGVIGPQTLEAIRNYEGDLVGDYLDGRREYVDTLIANSPSQEEFENGWHNRINNLEAHLNSDASMGNEPSQIAQAPPAPESATYTIQPGDSLSKIAAAHNTTVEELARLNGITDVNAIQAGATLNLSAQTPVPSEYTIQSGDSLSKIAAENNTTVEELARLNGITDVDSIQAGATLKLPGNEAVNSPSEVQADTAQPSTGNADFRDWVAENHPEQLANLDADGEFVYRTADAGGYANDGQSDYAAAKADIEALREQYQAEAHDTPAIDSDWNDATGNFDADTLAFIEEAEREFQLQDEEAAARAQEAAAQQQQLVPQDPGLIDGFNSVVGGAGQWLGEALVTTFGDEEAQSATAPGQILSPAEQTLQAQAGALNSVLMFQQALEGDNAFAKLTGGVSTLNALNQA